MKATSSPQDVTHAASLLAYLNHQRDQGIFCDCVLRQGQNSDQLYHAHRCILAASSPVLASILSSSGALVELHDPSLSDSVLPSLLDYIYTGVLPHPLSKQEYCRLLSAACQMQMKELQDALRANWLQIQGNATDDKNAPVIVEMYSFEETEDSYKIDFETFKHLPSSTTTYNFQSLGTTRQPLVNEIFQEPQFTSGSTDPSPEDGERKMKNQYVNGHTRTDLASLNDFNTFSILESIDKDNEGDCRQVTSLTQRESLRSKDDKAQMHDLSGVDVHHSPNLVKPDTRKRTPEEDLLRKYKERKRCSSSPSSSPPPCSEAVPVICHSSRAAVLQQSEEPHNQASESFVQPPSKIAHFSLSLGIDNDDTVEAITTECKDQNGVQSQDPRSTIRHTSCATGHKVDRDYNSNNVHLFKFNDTCKNASHNMNNNNQNAHPDPVQSHAEYYGQYVVQNKDSRRGSKHLIESDYDPVSSRNQHFDCFQCQRTLLTTSTQEPSKNQEAAVSLLMQAEDTGSSSQCEKCLEVEVKRGHSYSSMCLDVTDRKKNHYKTTGPITNWYTNINKDDKSRKYISNKDSSTQTKFRFITSQSGLANVTDSLSASKCGKVLESRKNSFFETTEACCFLTATPDHILSGTTRHTGQPNHWHLPHQGEPCDDASSTDSNHKPWKPGLSPDSDELCDEVNAPFSGKRSLSQYFSIEIKDQSDINTKHDELPVSSQHEYDKEIKQFVEIDTILSHDDAQANQDSSAARAERLDEAHGQRDNKEGNPSGIKTTQPGDCITRNISAMEVSKPKEHETKSSSTPVCSPLSEPNCDRVSKSSTVSVCIPSTVPASMPTDRSAHLSSPNHQPFQCSLCDRSFSQRGSLNRHVRSHLGVRPFPCPCCPMTFSRQYRVTEHMRVHQRSALGNDLQKSSVINND